MRAGVGRPTIAPLLGSAYYDSETGIVYVADGAAWVELAAAPTSSPLADVIALAAQDPSALFAAEAMAGECAKRLAPWKVAVMKRIVWRVGKPKQGGSVDGWPDLADSLVETLRFYEYRDEHPDIGNAVVDWYETHDSLWPSSGPSCPHTPAAGILRAGFALDTVGGACVLVCPPIS